MEENQSSFFINIPEIIRKRFLIKLRIENSQRIYLISQIGLFFFFLLMGLDYIRYSEGKIHLGNLYFYLFLNHLGFLLFLFPIFTIRTNRKAFAAGQYKFTTFFIYTWNIFFSFMLIVLAILSLYERNSLTMYAFYIITINFGVVLLPRDRALFNLSSFFAIFSVVILLYHQDLQLLVINFLESLGLTVTCFVVSTQIFNSFVQDIIKDKTLEIKNAQIEKQKIRGDELLNNILPEEIANELKSKGFVKPRHFSNATIMLIDIKDFSNISKSLTTNGLIDMLDHCFKNFDRITSKHRLEKIKTIGDAYLCVDGVPESNATHPNDCIEAAREILGFLYEWKVEQMKKNELFFEVRIGIHSGPLIAGVVGDVKFVFDVWGDAVNITARVETSGEAGRINISQTTYDLVKNKFKCIHRGKISAKNLDSMDMYFVDI